MNDLEVKSEQQNHSFKMRQYYTVLVTNGIAGFRVCFIGIKCGCKKVGKEEKKHKLQKDFQRCISLMNSHEKNRLLFSQSTAITPHIPVPLLCA